MNFLKRILVYIIIILFFASIFHDLSLEESTNSTEGAITNETENYSIYKVKVDVGDTVLSIVEEINDSSQNIAMNRVLNDFQTLNPDIDPYQLEANTFYYFPVYKKGD